MSRREDHLRFERLAEMQRLARDQRHHELGQTCEATDAQAAAEARSLAEQEAAAAALDAMFTAPRLCVDRLALAARQFHFSEAALADARQSTETARRAEDDARASLYQANHRLQLVGDIARKLRRKRAEKRENEAILQTVAVNASRGDRP
jgi:hypothetical protein